MAIGLHFSVTVLSTHTAAAQSPLRRTVHHDLIAEQANLGVALDIDGFVFAEFGSGGDEQGAVVYVSVDVNAPVVDGNGKPVGSHGRLEGTDGRMVLVSGLRVGTRGGVVGAGFEQEQSEGTENSFSVSSVFSC